MWGKLSKILSERGMTMYQLAKLSRVNKSHFSDLKSGKIKNLSWPNMVKISDALEVSLDEFK
ncbi:helix-turn-helix domain-containing protein [Streptococcus dysgalactiae]|uniref:helix-turn-helix domain-containing protein n=1 Tax=Streptococcus dysgalactiae TaxID=1334 RepID=UPI0012A7AD6A|nr:helix-turn-helix transcriptional regulator [Streptococcus dysgalactiae]QGH03235.1 XRE family transcriptional regulator [Streptococcus dysgalactiae subsp. dysgalactiae]QGH04923.1 XRE family transcriptional regulator [Streptococcus dysgalactiae subsp. dysgalactiae]